MCDERERLIEYIYGESAPDERRAIEAHLEQCPACRHEVHGLRSVRDDLLAWEVPPHEPIWRPVVPAPPMPARRTVPLWAMTAAASVLFALGVAGGVVVSDRAGRGSAPEAATMADAGAGGSVGGTVAQPVAMVTAEDLVRLEAAIVERLRAEMDEKVRAVASRIEAAPPVQRVSQPAAGPDLDLARRVAILESWMDDQISLNAIFNGNFGRLNSRTASLSQELELSRLQMVGLESAAQ